jgi:hypothetical protein
MKLLSSGEIPGSPSEAVPRSPTTNVSPTARASDYSAMADSEISVRDHQFVKTTFSKRKSLFILFFLLLLILPPAMICRVCLGNVKKSAVLCAQCSLIAHSKCTQDAPPTCDFRAQMLHFAKYAEFGSPTYSNPADGLPKPHPAPASDVPYISHSPRTSIDGSAPPASPLPSGTAHPPTAYKFMSAFKRSRSNLTTEAIPKAEETAPPRRRSGASKPSRKERPQSTTSNGTDPSSLRSAATGAGSTSSRQERKSAFSSSGKSTTSSPLVESTPTSSRMTTQSAVTEDATEYGEISYTDVIPGSLPSDTRRHRRKDSNCIIQ